MRRRLNHKGFTLAEVMIVVVILIILFALLAPNIIKMRKELRQTELDAKAEVIYLAAQNQMIKLRTSGNADKYAVGKTDQLLAGYPSDMLVDYDENGNPITRELHYILKSSTQAVAVMTPDTVSDELYKNSWVIEFDPSTGNIYSVYYSEKRNLDNEYVNRWDYYNKLRSKEERIKDGAWVGYYGGDVTASTSDTTTLKPTISVTNAEALTARIQCTAPVGINDVKFTVKMSDTDGHVKTLEITPSTPLGRTFMVDLTLDDLSSEETRFNYLYGDGDPNQLAMPDEILVPGTALTIEVIASSSNKLVNPGNASAVTNSLFADGSPAGQAYIECARHLQNLDESSGLVPNSPTASHTPITSAVQKSDLSFRNDADVNKDWYDLYSATGTFFNGQADGGANFKPISNDNLKNYDGAGLLITGLNVKASGSGDAGLFASVNGGVTLNGVNLIAAKVSSASGSAGALVGTVNGSGNEISKCGVYLLRSDVQGKTEEDIWISGANAGGLVGTIEGGGSLNISESFAATVIHGTERAGGLVGFSKSGGLDISSSYADDYLTGSLTGGLVCGNAASITNCYAAGFQTAQETAAGLVNGAISSASNSYTICAMEVPADHDSRSTALSIASVSKVYYFSPSSSSDLDLTGTEAIGSMDSVELKTRLGASFIVDTANTIAYNLMGQSLSTYPYPRLGISRHYGDWQAEFETGAMVYYEKYRDGSYGFFGANVNSTLKDDKVVVGDGYGVVYKASDAIPDTLTIAGTGINETYQLKNITPYKVRDENNVEFHIYPFSKAVVNKPFAAGSGFYTKLTITTSLEGSILEVYWFNPHFAKTVIKLDDDSVPDLGSGDTISIRTPRHLYDMSLYYKNYASKTNGVTFLQERDIDYTLYDWVGFTTYTTANKKIINVQEPIGLDAGTPFSARYDGGSRLITDVSFISSSGKFVGLFGYVSGRVQNVVLATEFDPSADDHYFVQRTQDPQPNDAVYMGVLAGYNAGVIENCAVAGYYVAGSDGTLHAYSNSYLYVGGLVGSNNGTIRNCSVEIPALRLSSIYAQVRMGGFTGLNGATGNIISSYSIGFLEIAESRGGSVNVGGFAGLNSGRISESYCATSVITSGDTAYSFGFAPLGGAVNDSYYLDRGSYYYVGSLRSYHAIASLTSGESMAYEEMASHSGAKANRFHSFYHSNTAGGRSVAYPFVAVVKDSAGNWTHYGDWMEELNMGTLGIFYWEREQFGSNDGYHFTYIGTAEGSADSGTTLCTAHDDGGVITEFGYGYYVKKGFESKVAVSSSGITYSGTNAGPGTYNTAAKSEIEKQVTDYTFYPYTTHYAGSGDYIYLDNGEKRTGVWELIYDGANSYSYEFTPFFANAMRRIGSGSFTLTASDWRNTDYSAIPGNSEDNVYEVRSVDQFRYINWNYETKNCDTLVYGEKDQQNVGNFKKYPYLQYATVLNRNNIQTREAAEANRSAQYWVQTHDIRETDSDRVITPIAGMATSSPLKPTPENADSSYENYLFTWFGGNYDGQSYKIQNVKVISEAYNVGLFGATAGAGIKNIILFADDENAVIERATKGKIYTISGKQINFEKGPGAYFIGGLIGIAYEYLTGDITNKVENCSIAGYTVIDRSTNQQGAGTANVGGLIGLANMNMDGCSAVVDILIDCTHEYGHMAYGSYIRVGGLAGSAGAPQVSGYPPIPVSVKNCYTGGTIRVSDRTQSELPTKYNNNGLAYRDTNRVGYSLNIFIGGVIAGSYAPNISNFTKMNSNAPDGIANIENCYTYVKLPNLEGNIRAVSYIAGSGDRYGKSNCKINVTNCYHLLDVNKDLTYDKNPPYFFVVNSKKLVITDEQFRKMLDGDLSCLKQLLNNDNQNGPNPDPATAIDYAELTDQDTNDMAARLNGSGGTKWSWVTVKDQSGISVDGMFSFSSHSSQLGKNYPFPTVISQKDNTFSTQTKSYYVNVHYGAWPLDSNYWENGRDTMDIFSDVQSNGYSEKTFTLNYAEPLDSVPTASDFTFSPDGKAEFVSCVHDSENKCYKVTIRALETGAVTVTEQNTQATFTLTITADVQLYGEPESLKMYKDAAQNVTLTATAGGIDFSRSPNGSWSLTAADAEDRPLFEIEPDPNNSNVYSVTSYQSGSRDLEAIYTYTYNGKQYETTLFIPTRTLGVVGLWGSGNAYSSERKDADSVGTSFSGNLSVPEGPEVMLFAPASDGDLAQFVIESKKVITEGDYSIEFVPASQIVTEDGYSFWPAYVRNFGTEASGPVSVEVKVKDPVTDATYTFQISGVAAPRNAISFESGGGEGIMFDMGYDGGQVTLPDCGFTRKGYSFATWMINDVQYPAGASVDVSGSMTAVAAWAANNYTVRFDANGGSGSMADQSFTYGTAQNLTSPCAFTAPDPGMIFAGWCTAKNGEGELYADGESVVDLTDKPDGTVTLYAQWVYDVALTLIDRGNEVYSEYFTGGAVPVTVIEPEGWAIDGWYTAANAGGVKVLDGNGVVDENAYSAVTEAEGSCDWIVNGKIRLTGDRTLYARFSREVYLPVDRLESESDNGNYVFVSGNTAGQQKAIRFKSTTDRTEVGSVDVTVNSAALYTENGSSADIYVTNVGSDAVWNVQWEKNLVVNGKSLAFFGINNIQNQNYFFRSHDVNLLVTTNNRLYNGNISNRTYWTYGVNNVLALQSEYYLVEKGTNNSVQWNGSKWAMPESTAPCYLFKLQTAYSFDPLDD